MSIHENPWEKLVFNSQIRKKSIYSFPFKAIEKDSPLESPYCFDGIIIKCKICNLRLVRSRFKHHFFYRHSSEEKNLLLSLESSSTDSGMLFEQSIATKSSYKEEDVSDDKIFLDSGVDEDSFEQLFGVKSNLKSCNSENINGDNKAISSSLEEFTDFEFLENKSIQNEESDRFHVDSLPWEMEDLHDHENPHPTSGENEVSSAVASISVPMTTSTSNSTSDSKEADLKSPENDLIFLLNSEKTSCSPESQGAIDSNSLIDQFACEKFPFLSPCNSPSAPESITKSSKTDRNIDADAERMIALIHNKLKEKKAIPATNGGETGRYSESINSSPSQFSCPQDFTKSSPSSQQQHQQQKKKVKKPNSLDCVPLHLRPFDPKLHCGVIKDGVMCRRSLLCKIHSMGLKRQVSRPGDVNSLMKELREANKLKRMECYRTTTGSVQTSNGSKPPRNCLPINQKPIILQTSSSHFFSTPQTIQTLTTASTFNTTPSVSGSQNGLTIFTASSTANGQTGNPNVLTFVQKFKPTNDIDQQNPASFAGYENSFKDNATRLGTGISISPIQKCNSSLAIQDNCSQNIINSSSFGNLNQSQINQTTTPQAKVNNVIFNATKKTPIKSILENSCLEIRTSTSNDFQMTSNFTSKIPILMKCAPHNVLNRVQYSRTDGCRESPGSQNNTILNLDPSIESTTFPNSNGFQLQRSQINNNNTSDSDLNKTSNNNPQGSWCILSSGSNNNFDEKQVGSNAAKSKSSTTEKSFEAMQTDDKIQSFLDDSVNATNEKSLAKVSNTSEDQNFDELDDIMTNILNITSDAQDTCGADSDTDGFIQEILSQDFIHSDPGSVETSDTLAKGSSEESRQSTSVMPMNDPKSVSSAKSSTNNFSPYNTNTMSLDGSNPVVTSVSSHNILGHSDNLESLPLTSSSNLPTSTSPPSSNLSTSSGYHTENSTTGSFLTLAEWKELQRNSNRTSTEVVDKEKHDSNEDQNGEFCEDIYNLLQSVSTNETPNTFNEGHGKAGKKSSCGYSNTEKPDDPHKSNCKKLKLSQEDIDNMLLGSDKGNTWESSNMDQSWPNLDYDIDEICHVNEKSEEDRLENAGSYVTSACQSPASSSTIPSGNSRLRLLLFEDSNVQNIKNLPDSQSYPSDSSVDSNGYASTNSSFLPRIETNIQPMNVPTAIVAPTTVTAQNDSSPDPAAFTKPSQVSLSQQSQNNTGDCKANQTQKPASIQSSQSQIILNNLPVTNCSVAITNNPNILTHNQAFNIQARLCNERKTISANIYEDKTKVLQQKSLNCITSSIPNAGIAQLASQQNSGPLQFSQSQTQYHQMIDGNMTKSFYGNHQIHLIPTGAFKGTPVILPSGTIFATHASAAPLQPESTGVSSIYQVATGSEFQQKPVTFNNLNAFIEGSVGQQSHNNSNQAIIQQAQPRSMIYANQNPPQQFNIVMASKPTTQAHIPQNRLVNQQSQAQTQQHFHTCSTPNSGPVQFFRLSNGQIISGIPSFNSPSTTTVLNGPNQNGSLQLQQLHIQGPVNGSVIPGTSQISSLAQIQGNNSQPHYAINTSNKGHSFLIKYPSGTLVQATNPCHSKTQPDQDNLAQKAFITNNGNGTYHLQQTNLNHNGGHIITNQAIQHTQQQHHQQNNQNSNILQVLLVPSDDGINKGQTLQMTQQYGGSIQLQSAKNSQQTMLFSSSSAPQTLDKFNMPKQPNNNNNLPGTAILLNGSVARDIRTIYSTSTSNFA